MSNSSEKLVSALEVENARVKLVAKTSEDKLKLFVECQLIEGSEETEVTRDDLLTLLGDLGKTDFVDTGVIDDIVKMLNEGKAVERRRIAKGIPPVEGLDGRQLVLLKSYNPTKSKQGVEYVDHRFIRAFDNIEKDTIVGRIYPPQEGKVGRDVYGNEIPAKPGQPFKSKIDKTITLTPPADGESFETLVANESGYLLDENGALKVVHELVIKHDIDYSTGDINEFVGAVTVQGNVGKNFRVTAREDIAINGNVEAGTVSSSDGSIQIKGQVSGTQNAVIRASSKLSSKMISEIIGKDRPLITAAGGLSAEILAAANIEVKGDITVTKEARECLLRTQGRLLMEKGHLMHSEVYTVYGVEAKIIGTPAGGRLVINLCSDIESTKEYSDIVKRIDLHERAIEIIDLQIGPYSKSKRWKTSLKPELKEKVEKLFKKLDGIKKGLAALEEQKEELLQTAQHAPCSRVNFFEEMHTGVIIKAGEAVFTPDDDLEGPATIEYLAEEDQLVLGEYQPLEGGLESTDNDKEKKTS